MTSKWSTGCVGFSSTVVVATSYADVVISGASVVTTVVAASVVAAVVTASVLGPVKCSAKGIQCKQRVTKTDCPRIAD